jgi:hypothetical protein
MINFIKSLWQDPSVGQVWWYRGVDGFPAYIVGREWFTIYYKFYKDSYAVFERNIFSFRKAYKKQK